jgi:hypothetical protein
MLFANPFQGSQAAKVCLAVKRMVSPETWRKPDRPLFTHMSYTILRANAVVDE